MRWLAAFAAAGACIMGVGAATVAAQDSVAPGIESQPVTESTAQNASTTCAVPLPPNQLWLPQEVWAWEQRLCLGERADMRVYFQRVLRKPLECNPKDRESWPAEAVLSSKFLETIVRHPGFVHVVEGTDIEITGYQDLLPDNGIQIFCAHFRDGIDLENASLTKPLVLGLSRFDSAVNLRRFESESFVVLFNSFFDSYVQAYAADIEDDFFIQGGSEFRQPLNLIAASVGGNLDIRNSLLHNNLAAENIFVGGSLRLHEQSSFAGVDLRRAQIGNVLDTSEAVFRGTFQADAIEVGGFAHFRRGATFQDISMISAKIRGSMDTIGARFNGAFSAYGIKIDESLFLRGGAVFHDLNLSNAVIGGSLELRGSEYLGRVDLTNARIVHEMQIASPLPPDQQTEDRRNYDPPRWGDDAQLILRNLRAEALQDTAEAWDNLDGRLDLVGFTYQQLGGLRSTRDSIMAARDVDWMLGWLSKQRERDDVFQPQPYEQLARVLREGGWIEKADDVIIARYNYQLGHPTTPIGTKAWLAVKWLVIGYGLEVWLSIAWLIGLQAVGAVVMGLSPVGRQIGWVRSVFYSFDTSMPFVDLNPLTHNELSENSSQTLKFYFGAHRIVGLILVTFLAAGMSGLTTSQ